MKRLVKLTAIMLVALMAMPSIAAVNKAKGKEITANLQAERTKILNKALADGRQDIVDLVDKYDNEKLGNEKSWAERGVSILGYAIHTGVGIPQIYDVVPYLVEECEVDVNAIDFRGTSIVHITVNSLNIEVLKYLIEKRDAVVTVINDAGETPLDWAKSIAATSEFPNAQEIVDYLETILEEDK